MTKAEAIDSPNTSTARRKNNYFDGLKVSGQHRLIFFIIILAYFFEQMDNWNFGFAAPAIFASWGLAPEDTNMAMAKIIFWYFIGMTAGGFLGGIISDFIGRRNTFLFSIVLFSACSVINGLPIDNLTVFVIARTLTGFGVFCMMVCSQTYMAEMTPAESRGKWQGRVAAVGFCAVPVIAFLCRMIIPLSPDAWRLVFYFGGTGIVGFFMAVRYLKESPRWLVSRGRTDEAEKVVRQITGEDIDLSDAAAKVAPKIRVKEVLYGMFTPRYIGRTLLLILVFLCITPAGFTFTSWTAKLLTSVPALDPATGAAILDAVTGQPLMLYDQSTMLTIMTFISCGVPVGCYLASLISDKGGRKLPLAIMLVMASAAALLFACFYDSFLLVGLCGFLLSVFNMAGSFILSSYASESYPTQMRNTAIGTHNALARLGVASFQFVIPWVVILFSGGAGLGINDIAIVFTTCACLFLLPVPFILLFGKRTGGKALEDIV